MRPLDINDLTQVKDLLRRYPPSVSELTFTNLFVWRASRPLSLVEKEDTLWLITRDQENNAWVFGPPLGKASLSHAIRMRDAGIKGFIRIPEAFTKIARQEGLHIFPDRDNADYVYRVSDLGNLEGRKYHKKRNLIKQCLTAYQCQYEKITPRNIAECIDMQDRWCRARNCGLDPGLCNEYAAIQQTFRYSETLSLIGGAIRVNGIIQAYAIGEELAPQTAVCHFEKAMPDIVGISQLINQWFAHYALAGFEFVNREQDLGIAGLRQAKESYFPHHMVTKFIATTPSADKERLKLTGFQKGCY